MSKKMRGVIIGVVITIIVAIVGIVAYRLLYPEAGEEERASAWLGDDVYELSEMAGEPGTDGLP